MTTMERALRDAGVEPAEERLRRIALDAVRSNPRNWDGARDALYAAVRSDAALLWELFAPFRHQAVQMALTAAASELRRAETPVRGLEGRAIVVVPTMEVLPAPPKDAPATGQGGPGQPSSADQSARAGAAAVVAAVRRSLLDTFRVNGSPIGDITPREATAWAGARERDARFVRALVENLPPDEPIRKWRTADEAEALYAKAETGDA